ncbi:MAG TPA: GWxTD domain-containing protein [Terriglobales bacterium]|jgi:GWxTD domain-containing protein|nr:GWxTD domain-containing protein [Terriglobales bacterium]
MDSPFIRKSSGLILFFLLLVLSGSLVAQTASADVSSTTPTDQSAATTKATEKDQSSPDVDKRNRQLTDKQKKEQQKRFNQEVQKVYKKWLDEDVRYIISDEEKSAFKQLSNDEERDNFIEAFWARRDPTPDTVENEFKEEHYQRIAYANEHFPAGIPGWKTDRGRMYIMYGKPDEIESHPSGGTYNRPQEEGGGETSTYPFETWRYRYLEGIGQEIIIEFVDTCMCGDYHMTIDRSEKDALKNVPGAGLTQYEQMGLANKADRFTNSGLEQLGAGPFNQDLQSKQFDRLETFAKLNRPPAIKFKDLDEVVTSKVRYNLLPFDVRADFVRVTSDTVLVPVTLQIRKKNVTYVNKDGVERGTLNIYGRVTTLTGRIAQTFEDTVQDDQPVELLPKILENSSIYWKALPLRPGRYRFDIVVKDVNGDRMGTWSRGITVPDMSDDKGLTNSTLILADVMEKVPSKSVGAGNFVIGTTKVRPRLDGADGTPAKFNRNQKLNFWMQVYNLGVSDQSKKSSAQIEYDIVNSATKKAVVHTVETTDQLGNSGEQITLEKSMSLASLEPGMYELTIKVNDNISKQSIAPTAKFLVQ